jgi:hypothetical protein
MKSLLVLIPLSFVAGCRPSTVAPPSISHVTPGPPRADSALVTERKLLCARIGAATESIEPTRRRPLDHHAAEGGDASLYVRDDFHRIEGTRLGESYRENLDYRFHGRDLVCTRTTTTSAWTIEERSQENPDGRPTVWREDFRVYAGGKQIYATMDEAPSGEGDSRDLASTIAFANELRTLLEQQPPD